MTPTVLVVRKESPASDLIALSLRHAGFLVVRPSSVAAASIALETVLPDLVLIDESDCREQVAALARRLRENERTNHVPIILMGERNTQTPVEELDPHVDDIVSKPVHPGELLGRVRRSLGLRSPHLSTQLVTCGAIAADPQARRVTVAGQRVSLGPTEFRLLLILLEHPDRVFSRAELLDVLWGERCFIEERTVDVHVRRLRAALIPSGEHTRIETVRGRGYRLSAAQPD